ncbi:MAG: hypothetical protein ABSE46_25375, partial [Terracidiphilus sp.]
AARFNLPATATPKVPQRNSLRVAPIRPPSPSFTNSDAIVRDRCASKEDAHSRIMSFVIGSDVDMRRRSM